MKIYKKKLKRASALEHKTFAAWCKLDFEICLICTCCCCCTCHSPLPPTRFPLVTPTRNALRIFYISIYFFSFLFFSFLFYFIFLFFFSCLRLERDFWHNANKRAHELKGACAQGTVALFFGGNKREREEGENKSQSKRNEKRNVEIGDNKVLNQLQMETRDKRQTGWDRELHI